MTEEDPTAAPDDSCTDEEGCLIADDDWNPEDYPVYIGPIYSPVLNLVWPNCYLNPFFVGPTQSMLCGTPIGPLQVKDTGAKETIQAMNVAAKAGHDQMAIVNANLK